jgi:hypothetical protein
LRIAVVEIVTHSGLTVSCGEMLIEFYIVYGEEEMWCCLVSDRYLFILLFCSDLNKLILT